MVSARRLALPLAFLALIATPFIGRAIKGPAEQKAGLTAGVTATSIYTSRIGTAKSPNPPCAPDDRFCSRRADIPVKLTRLSVPGRAEAVECQWEGKDPFLPDGSRVDFVENPDSGERAFWFHGRRVECIR